MMLMEKDDEERIQALDKLHEDACARVQDLELKRREALGRLAVAPTANERHKLDLDVRQLERQWREAVEHRDEARQQVLDEYRHRGDIDQDRYDHECKALERERQVRLRRYGQRDMINERTL